MDIQKEREAFEEYFKEKYQEFHNEVFDENGDDRAIIGYSFAWSAWQAAKAQAVPEGFVLVPKTNSDKGIESMAMRYRHDFPLLDADYQEGIKSQMRQLYEEAVGLGFYSHKAQEQVG